MERFIKTISTTNFRPAPTTNRKPIKNLAAETVVEILEETVVGNWHHGRLADGTTGYITSLSKYVADYTPPWLATAMEIIRCGDTYLGKPYVFGSTRSTDISFDCSDFVKWIYGKNGISLTSNSRTQSVQGDHIEFDQLRSGDLIFFAYDNGYVHHVAMYVRVGGKDRILHTYNMTCDIYDMNLIKIKEDCGGVTWSNFNLGSYWRNKATLARRVT